MTTRTTQRHALQLRHRQDRQQRPKTAVTTTRTTNSSSSPHSSIVGRAEPSRGPRCSQQQSSSQQTSLTLYYRCEVASPIGATPMLSSIQTTTLSCNCQRPHHHHSPSNRWHPPSTCVASLGRAPGGWMHPPGSSNSRAPLCVAVTRSRASGASTTTCSSISIALGMCCVKNAGRCAGAASTAHPPPLKHCVA